MKVVERDLAELEPFEKNPKKHPGSQIKLLVRSIEEFGFTSPILTVEHNGKHLIVAGHARYKAAKEKGLKSVPTIDLGLPYEKAVAYNLADNRLAELADWDRKLVRLLMEEEIPKELWDVTGFRDLLIKDDNFEPNPATETRCASGQIWRLGKHRLMCGDSRKIEDIEKLMDGAKADALFTDPPYRIETYDCFGSKGNARYGEGRKPPEFCEWLPNCLKVTKDDSNFLIFEQDKNIKELWDYLLSLGLKWANLLIWNAMNRRKGWCKFGFNNMYDPILFFRKGKGYFNHSTAKIDGTKDVFIHSVFQNAHGAGWEVANIKGIKPIPVVSYFLRFTCPPEGNVLDCFGGSGSTLMACEELGFNCYVMEFEPTYCEMIMQRWERLTGKKAELVENES